VLDHDNDHSWIAWTDPVFVELVGEFLDSPIIAGPVESFLINWNELRVGRLLTEAVERVRKMAVKDDEWVMSIGVRIKPLRQDDVGP